MPQRRFRNWIMARPRDIQDGDAFAMKVVVVAGQDDDWTAYTGDSGWSDEDVASHGDKLSEATARLLFPVMVATGRHWRH